MEEDARTTLRDTYLTLLSEETHDVVIPMIPNIAALNAALTAPNEVDSLLSYSWLSLLLRELTLFCSKTG